MLHVMCLKPLILQIIPYKEVLAITNMNEMAKERRPEGLIQILNHFLQKILDTEGMCGIILFLSRYPLGHSTGRWNDNRMQRGHPNGIRQSESEIIGPYSKIGPCAFRKQYVE